MKKDASNRFHRRGFAILLICSAILLCIGLIMLVGDFNSTGLITSRFRDPIEQTISWHTPVFGSIILFGIALLWRFDKPSLPKIDLQGKRAVIFDKIADSFKDDDFKRRGNHFFKRNGAIGYCLNIQNDKWNNSEVIRFTLNVGIYTDSFWLEHEDFKHIGIVPPFPKEYDCAIRERIGNLLPVHNDKCYCITADTDVLKLWEEIEHDLEGYVKPFFDKYHVESDVVPNQFIYKRQNNGTDI